VGSNAATNELSRQAGKDAMPRDIFHNINALDQATIDRVIARLEFRASDPTFVALREAYFDKLPLGTARRVLALGCGTGVEVRAMKRRLEFGGEVVGIDLSPRLIEEARRLTAAEGLLDGVEYRVGDACALDLPGASFDVVLAHTLLSHVPDPRAVLQEAHRVARPGAMAAVFDGDFASLTFAHPNPDLARRVEEALQEVFVNSPRAMRDLPRFLKQVGLELVEASAHAYADIGAGGFFANMVEIYGPILAEAGSLPAADVEDWRAGQARALAEGFFFGAANFYTYLVQRPERLAQT
jgi:ubiquinone/menaquinone biosynthesis C-methylase UbiE